MGRGRGRARSFARTASMGLWTSALLVGVRLHQSVSDRPQRQAVWERWMRLWTRGLGVVFGVDEVLANSAPEPAKGARLVVANHRSPMDIPLLLGHFGGCVLSRDDLARWPILGLAARWAGTIFVNRDDVNSGVAALRQIRRRLRQGWTVILFPEGTTFRGDEVRTFQPAAFAATRGLDVEVLPVGIAYEPGSEFVDESFLQHLGRVAARPTTRVALSFGPGRPAAGSRRALAQEIQAEVQQLVHLARTCCDRGLQDI